MRKKGFTLIELIIVIAIIGVLAGVLIPSWGAYIRRARTRSQNLKAKTILNAAQTVVTDMKFSERKGRNKYLAASGAERENLAEKYLYDSNPADLADYTEWYYYWDGSTGALTDDTGKVITKDGYMSYSRWATITKWNDKIADEINQILKDDEIVYRIHVKDYKVMSVVSARFENDRYLGTYPKTLDELEEEKGNDFVDKIRDKKITGLTGADMDSFNMG